ncbi:hypothetical protein ABPG77_011474 [Micractinium sp. CCAP 211/92]
MLLHPVAREAWASIHSIYAVCLETPLVPAPWLADLAGGGASVHLKAEDRQAAGTAKTRGTAHKLFSLTDEQLGRGVVAASTGNHALALMASVAAAARRRGLAVPARIFLPRSADPGKLDRLREAGAQFELVGADSAEAEAAAREAAHDSGATFVSSYNDPALAGGQGSIGVELLMQLPRGRLDTVFLPVGGGGLAAGVAAVLKSVDPSIHVVGCQPASADLMRRSVAAGHAVHAEQPAGTLAEGSLPPGGRLETDAVTLEPCRRFVDEWVVVDERDIAQAVLATVSHTGMQVEAATGVAVAAYQKLAPQMRGKHSVIVAAGGNMTAEGMERVWRVAGRAAAGAPA